MSGASGAPGSPPPSPPEPSAVWPPGPVWDVPVQAMTASSRSMPGWLSTRGSVQLLHPYDGCLAQFREEPPPGQRGGRRDNGHRGEGQRGQLHGSPARALILFCFSLPPLLPARPVSDAAPALLFPGRTGVLIGPVIELYGASDLRGRIRVLRGKRGVFGGQTAKLTAVQISVSFFRSAGPAGT